MALSHIPSKDAKIMTRTKAPVVFIHGLWLHATSWQPWQELFAEAGYEPTVTASRARSRRMRG
jgi:pimeloyl-ACP methyl ester carboxylesterase